MYLKKLFLQNFRCHHESLFEFCQGINTIVGANARGKTSILEALHLLVTGRSFRTSQLLDLVRIGSQGFSVEALFVKYGIEQRLKISSNGKEKAIWHNGNPCSSTTSLLGLLHGVVITPDDAALVKGSPIGRRHFLDLQIAQIDPLYVHHLGRYNRAMRQRNTLLRAKSAATLGSWEHEMANSAGYIVHQRYKAIGDLQTSGSRLHHILSGEHENLSLSYKTGMPAAAGEADIKQYYIEQFQKLRHREMALGITLSGPHKDDLTIAIGQKEARFFASEGQQRSCVAAMRLAEWERLHAATGEPPLMLIDDVGISLDSVRRDNILRHMQHLGQVFLTTTQEMNLPVKDRPVCVVNLELASKG